MGESQPVRGVRQGDRLEPVIYHRLQGLSLIHPVLSHGKVSVLSHNNLFCLADIRNK